MTDTPKFCEQCGAPLAEDIVFCESCGHAVPAAEPAAAPIAAAPPPPDVAPTAPDVVPTAPETVPAAAPAAAAAPATRRRAAWAPLVIGLFGVILIVVAIVSSL